MGLKSAWRTQITGAGLGTRLANSIRLASFTKSGDSLNAAALVCSNAPVIVGAHDTGPLIRSNNGFWLGIPTPATGKSTRGGRGAAVLLDLCRAGSFTAGQWNNSLTASAAPRVLQGSRLHRAHRRGPTFRPNTRWAP